MKVTRIYHGLDMVYRVYHKGEIIFLRDPIIFHAIENGNLIVYGALVANNAVEGLYLDCLPDWSHPMEDGSILSITQVYSAKQNGNILEVE